MRLIYTFIYQFHIVTGMIAFFIGPFQFVAWLRRNAVALHRLLGKAYILCALFSSLTGLVISFHSPCVMAVAGTSLQCTAWFTATLLAYLCILKRRVAQHRKWMMRSYALVLAAPLVRIGFYGLQLLQIAYAQRFEVYYSLLVWMGFVPLMMIEVYLRSPISQKITKDLT